MEHLKRLFLGIKSKYEKNEVRQCHFCHVMSENVCDEVNIDKLLKGDERKWEEIPKKMIIK